MDPNRFDRISQLFADRRLTRRAAMTASAGAAATMAALPLAGHAQSASPAASPVASPAAQGDQEKTTFLFVQSFQSGTLSANTDNDLHTLTLEHGLGQTIYFGDRPSREVGVTPTKDFIKGFNFGAKNPPNAALIVETGDSMDLAVLELTAPTYDEATRTATYQVRGLDAWKDGPTLDLKAGPADLSGISPTFDSANLLIDDCPDESVACVDNNNGDLLYKNELDTMCYAWGQCMPCVPYYHSQPSNCADWDYWKGQCDADSQACPSGDCHPYWGQGISDLLGCS